MHLTSNVLQKCALFKNISGQEITTLLSAVCCKEEAFAEKSIIFSPIQKADRMGIILKGAVDIQKVFPTGKIVIIKRKRTADILAGIEMFSSYGYYTETLVACKPCTLLLIPQKDLLTLLGLDHRISLNFLEYAANSALVLKNKIGILSLDSIQAKIAGHLVHDHKINGALEITLPFSKKNGPNIWMSPEPPFPGNYGGWKGRGYCSSISGASALRTLANWKKSLHCDRMPLTSPAPHLPRETKESPHSSLTDGPFGAQSLVNIII